MRSLPLILCAVALAGCTHAPTNPPPAFPPPLTYQAKLPPLPPPPTEEVKVEPTAPVEHRVVQVMPCGETVEVHVGKLDLNLPKGGKLELGEVKADLMPYHVLLEDVTFKTGHGCLVSVPVGGK